MPLFRYFLAVGALLTLGLLALSAYLEPASRDAAARVSVTPTTASLAHIAPRQPNSKWPIGPPSLCATLGPHNCIWANS